MTANSQSELYVNVDDRNRIRFLRSDCDENQPQPGHAQMIPWDDTRSTTWRANVADEMARILKLESE